MNILLVWVVSFSLSLLIGICWTIKCLIDVNNATDDDTIDDEEECEAHGIFEMASIQPTITQRNIGEMGNQFERLIGVNNDAYL